MHCKVTEQLFGVFRCLEEAQKKPKDYGNGVPLHHGEVMFLELTGRYPGENVSGVARRLGITKGAVTQMAAKLLEKGLIETRQRQGNLKEKFYALTPAGEQAVDGHQRFHSQANARLCNYFATLGPEETATIFQFLGQLKECAPFCEFPCRCHEREQDPACQQIEPAAAR